MSENNPRQVMMAAALAGDELARMLCIQGEILDENLSSICRTWLEEMADEDDADAIIYYCEYMIEHTPPDCDWGRVERYCYALLPEEPATAYRLLAHLHMLAESRVYDNAKADAFLQKAVELGDDEACYILAFKWRDEGHDAAEIRKLLEKIPSEDRLDDVWTLLAKICLETGDAESALKYTRNWLREYPKSAEAMLQMAYYYATGSGVRMNKETALKYYQKAANLGNPLAMYYAGMMNYAGDGCRRNYKRAVDYFRRALAEDCGLAFCPLAECYLYGHGVKADAEEALQLLQDGVESEDAESCELLAVLYANGICVEKNLQRAHELIEQAAEYAKGNRFANESRILEQKQKIERELEVGNM